MSKANQSKPYWEMNTSELRAATAEFDRPSPRGRFRPMTDVERAQWERMKRKPGRPKVGQGVEVVSISIERGLLGRADKLAKRLKVSRAKLVSVGLEQVLAASSGRSPKRAGVDRPGRSGTRGKAA